MFEAATSMEALDIIRRMAVPVTTRLPLYSSTGLFNWKGEAEPDPLSPQRCRNHSIQVKNERRPIWRESA